MNETYEKESSKLNFVETTIDLIWSNVLFSKYFVSNYSFLQKIKLNGIKLFLPIKWNSKIIYQKNILERKKNQLSFEKNLIIELKEKSLFKAENSVIRKIHKDDYNKDVSYYNSNLKVCPCEMKKHDTRNVKDICKQKGKTNVYDGNTNDIFFLIIYFYIFLNLESIKKLCKQSKI